MYLESTIETDMGVWFYCYYVYVLRGVELVYTTASIWGERQLAGVDSLSTMWVRGIELVLSGLGRVLLPAESSCWPLK